METKAAENMHAIKINEILREAGVIYSTIYKGQTKRDNWDCDAWSISFTVTNSKTVTESFEFYTGLGRRSKIEETAEGRLTAHSLRNANRNCIAWEQARQKFCKPVTPESADVLYSLVLSARANETSFNQWCDEFGYNSDSMKAFSIYQECCNIAIQLNKIFTYPQLHKIKEILQDY